MTSLQIYRKLNPRARRTKSTAIIHSGGKQTIFSCVCGARHTCATDYRQAKHVSEWKNNHKGCLDNWVAENCI